MKSGASASDNSPWAMVVPPGNSFFARSWSTWIHCSSHVASAKWLNIRMFVTWSDLHFGHVVGNDELGVRYGHDFGDADIRRGFQQRRFTIGESDDSHIRHDQTHRPC